MIPIWCGDEASDLFPNRLQRHAHAHQNQPILAFLDEQESVQQSWTFAELDQRARAIAVHLQARGLREQTVGLAYPSGLEFVAAFCGALYAGAIAVPMSLPRSHGSDERASTILADSGSSLLLTCGAHRSVIEKQLKAAGLPVEIVATDSLPDESDKWTPGKWLEGQLAFLQYTSGSTRLPRGVMISHGNLAANLESLREMLRTHRDSVGVSWLPLFHDMGLIAGVLEPLWVGYSAYLMTPATFVQSPMRWLRAFTRYRGTIGGGPNFGYQACVDAAKTSGTSGLDLSSWELAWNGAEPIRPDTLEAFRKTFAPVGLRQNSLTPSFGLAEATLLVTTNNGDTPAYELVVDEQELRLGRVHPCAAGAPRAKRLVASGRPGTGTDVRIVDPETRREKSAQHVGEIWVSSDSVGKGYWRKQVDTVVTFRAYLDTGEGPFLHTGDLGFLEGGELFVTSRLKDVLVIRGANYYPHDLEHTVESSHPALRPDAGIVVGLEDGRGVRVVAAQEVRRDCWRSIRPNEVCEAIRRAVAREHQLALAGVVLLKPYGIPKTSSGKVQRGRCRAALEERDLPVLHEWWAPAAGQTAPIDFNGEPLTQPGVLERQLVDWLRRELGIADLGWNTPLMELGIDSLKGVELGNALAAAFTYSFPATLLIDYPTVEALAGMIRRDVLSKGEKAETAPEQPSPLAAEIAALNESELDTALQRSIEKALARSAGQA
jgi:acyl-CoA synthetase (AMP-forming)/AMP-acid ligase II